MIKNKKLKKITTQLLKANILSVSIVFGAFAQGYPAQESFLPIELNNTLSSTPVIFHIAGSNKIVLDLFNANGIIKNYPSILPHDPFVSKIDSREIGDRVRVVFDMKQPVKYKAVNTNGKVNNENGVFKTTKTSGIHGIGLSQINDIIKKHNGYIKRSHENNVFNTNIMINY